MGPTKSSEDENSEGGVHGFGDDEGSSFEDDDGRERYSGGLFGLNLDWLCGRDDSSHFNESSLSGAVVLLPLKESTKERMSIEKRACQPNKYFRYRIITVDDQEVATVYAMDRYASYEEACHAPPRELAVQEIDLIEVMKFGTFLSREDVNSNLTPTPHKCDHCGGGHEEASWRLCDGNYPSCSTLGYTTDSMGMQFRCHRGLACCDTCAEENLIDGRWYCNACRRDADPEAESATVQSTWGSNISPPGDTDRCVSPGTNVHQHYDISGFVHPATSKHQKVTAMEARRLAAAERARNYGGEEGISAAAELLEYTRRHNLSNEAITDLLQTLHRMSERSYLGTSQCLLPKTLQTLVDRGEGILVSDADMLRTSVRIDVSSLRQLQRSAVVSVLDFPSVIQEMFDDVACRFTQQI